MLRRSLARNRSNYYACDSSVRLNTLSGTWHNARSSAIISYRQQTNPMPFAPNPVTTEQLVNALTDLYGSEVNTLKVRSTADSLKVSYATLQTPKNKSVRANGISLQKSNVLMKHLLHTGLLRPEKMIPSSSLATMLLLKIVRC